MMIIGHYCDNQSFKELPCVKVGDILILIIDHCNDYHEDDHHVNNYLL